MDTPTQNSPLEPLPYHVELRDYLKSQERELWNWFASARAQADYTAHLRMELLKSTYRLDAAGHPDLYQCLEETKARLQLNVPVTIYQAQNSHELNATLYFIPGEGHVVLSGPVLNLLNADETKAVLGHELAHYHLWEWQNGELHIVDRLIQGIAADPRAGSSHEHTARRLQLYTEIFADRGSLCATGDLHPVVAGLVKMETGLAQVSASAYLKQADEIFVSEDHSTQRLSHPEAFIRARALRLWSEKGNEAYPHVCRMIEGASAFESLDLIGQRFWTFKTRTLLEHFLQPRWFQTSLVLAHAKLFFPDFQPAATPNAAVLEEFKAHVHDGKLREYLSYLLLDFSVADPELDELPLAAALALSQHLEFDAQFEKIAAKELKMKVRDVRKLKEQAAEKLAGAESGGALNGNT